MAIVRMAKVMIISYRAEASELLEALQREGICQVLNAQEAIVSKDMELSASKARPREIEEVLHRLQKCITYLESYARAKKGMAGILSPLAVIDKVSYEGIVSDRTLLGIVERCEKLESSIEKLKGDCENLSATIEQLRPWRQLQTPIEEIGQLQQTVCLAGLLPLGQLEQVQEQIAELAAAMEQVGTAGNRCACLVVCLKEKVTEVQKLLRQAEFEPTSFGSWTGTVEQIINQHTEKLDHAQSTLQEEINSAAALSRNLLKLQILCDHYENLLKREQAKDCAPVTEQTVIFEGWVKERNYRRLEKIVSKFSASSLAKIEPAEGEEIPVEIENSNYVRPFEFITRLYGMPQSSNVDPTVYLAPFFALFFGICLGDAGYGLVMLIAAVLIGRKMQGDRKLVWMLAICSVFAILVGVLTGSWFGDSISKFAPRLDGLRVKLMWFDPLERPMLMMGIAMGLGYIHLMTGLLIAFFHNLKVRSYAAAAFEQLTWLIMLNSIVAFAFSKAGVLPAGLGTFCSRLAIVPAVLIVLFSSREGGWGARIGMGVYNLFSTVFYLGDVLSYLRLMALGMVSSGLGMAINVMAELTLQIPYIGLIVTLLLFIGGHGFNLILSILGAFVHTMRLQFVEFFPKFLSGGGRMFEPLQKEYKHICIT